MESVHVLVELLILLAVVWAIQQNRKRADSLESAITGVSAAIDKSIEQALGRLEPAPPFRFRVAHPVPDTGVWQVLEKCISETPGEAEGSDNGSGSKTEHAVVKHRLRARVREDSPAWWRAHANPSVVLRNEATGKILEAVQ